MVSYFKTQWFRLLCAVACLVISLVFAFSPAPDTSTLEGTNESISTMFASTGWLISSYVLFGLSFIDWYSERLTALEAKAKKYDAVVDKTNALYEANKVDREQMKLMNDKIKVLEYQVGELKRGNKV